MIEASALCKSFAGRAAVKEMSFSVQPGEVAGFLGPNGAGKSTTMKMLTGFLAADAGTARLCGVDVMREPVRARHMLGYLPEGAPCYAEMKVHDFLTFIAKMRGYRGAELQERIRRVQDLLELGEVSQQLIGTLSKGFNRRVGLAQAVLHEPPVLILDEPTDGLDPNQKHQVRELIRRLAPGRTILVSTHILEEIEAICSRVLLIARGRLVTDATPLQLRRQSRYWQAVCLRSSHSALDASLLARVPGVQQVEAADDGALILIAEPGQVLLPAVQALVRQQAWQLDELSVEAGRLDDVFRRLTQENAS
ncbi:MAG: ATP-binding cassette domain-containing protein [Gammaproteobacteria bacterium]|nr:ATP-binding cassette domain-containing protein [Gammaproteobacteria bacterium]